MKKILFAMAIMLLCNSIAGYLVSATEPFSLLWTRDTLASVQGMAVGDINSDGKNEVVYAEWTGMVYAVDSMGNVLWTFPTGWYDNIEIGDLQGDGSKEVVVASADRHVYCLNGTNGDLIWSFPTAELAGYGPLTLTDINGDGKLEIVAGEWDSNVYSASPANVYVLDHGGNLLWKYTLADDVIPSAADVNKDGKEEVFAYYGRPDLTSTGHLYRFNPDGSVNWTVAITGCADSLSYFADLTSDGDKEIVTMRNSDLAILVFNSTDGSLLKIIPHPYGGLVNVVDLENNGKFEFLTWKGSTLYTLDSDGNKIWERPLTGKLGRNVAADLNGDARKEIIAGVSGMLFVLDPQGLVMWNWTVPHYVGGHKHFVWEIEIADIDGDTSFDIIAATSNEWSYQTEPEIVSVFKNQLMITISATIDVDPDVLNLKSKGKWITAYIELPGGYDVNDINVTTVVLNDPVPAELHPTEVGDYDSDGVPDLMVKFNSTAVSEYILSKGMMTGNVTLTITGQLNDGTLFQGSDVIRVRMPGDINIDGKVDLKDVYLLIKAFGSYPEHPRWNPIADEDEDNKVDMRDIYPILMNFGKTYS